MKEHLKHFFPFLNKEFRKLEESELKSEKTFKELFPNEETDFSKLRTLFKYQNAELKAFDVAIDKPKTTKIKGKFSKEVINYLTDKDAKI